MNDSSVKTWKTLALVFMLISAVLAFSFVTGFLNFNSVDKARKNYPLINPLRFEIEKKDVVVNLQPLREYIRNLVEERGPGTISVYFEFFNTGANISVNSDLKIQPASLAKLPLAMVVMKQVENKTIALDDELTLQENQIDRGSGELYKQPVGTRFTVEYLLTELLHHSDNTAYHMLADRVGKTEFSAIIEDTGLDELFDENGKVSSKEYGRVLRSLYNSSFLDIEHSSKVLDLLTKTDFDEFLGSAIPANVPFAHKWGAHTMNHVFSDAGIVYLPQRSYMLVVMVQGDKTSEEREKAAGIMKDISTAVYQYISQYNKK